MVDKHPEAMYLFRKIDDPDSGIFEAHCLRIFNYFDYLVNLLHDKEAFRRECVRLGHEHAAIPGMLGKYFKVCIDIIENHHQSFKIIYNF